MRRKISTVIFLLTILGVGWGGQNLAAQESGDEHLVQKGDTLWDLSEFYLNDPLLWPKIWKLNPDIGNPHNISPGQVVKIPILGDRPETEAISEGKGMAMEKPMPPAEVAPPVKKVRIDLSGKKPLPITVAKKAERPEIVEEKPSVDTVISKAYDRGIGIVTNDIPNRGRILHTEEGWNSAGIGGTILIDAPGAKVGEFYGVYRDRGKVKHPSRWTGSPGNLLSDVGIIEVVASDSTKQLGRIKRAFIGIETGDILGPVPPMPVVAENEKGRMLKVDGTIVAVQHFNAIAGVDDIVYLDLGQEDGLVPGDTLFVKNREAEDNRSAGEILILRVTPKTAAALVTKESEHELTTGDRVERLL